MGFSFEYPALYEQPDYREICGLHEYDNMVIVADQIVIWSEPASGRTAVRLADSMIDADQLSVEHREDNDPGDRVSVSFRSAGSNAYGSFTVDTYRNALYVLAFYAGTLSCEVPEREMGRFVALAHISETWHMFEPKP